MAQTTTQQRTQAKPEQAIAEPAPVDNLPAPRPRTTVSPIVPATWQEVTAIAGAICRAKMAPKSYCDGQGEPITDKVAIAIMHGMEVGLTPMAALQSLAVINGMPGLFGDGMLAVVRASGLLEDFQEEMEWDEKGPVKATCKVKRRGEPSWGVMDCARADAQIAGWWDKAGPWKLTPHRMLQMRARGWALRDKFADVLRGLRSAEELQDMVDVTPTGSATVSPIEPQRRDYQSQPDAPASQAVPAESGQPAASSPAGAGGDSKPEAASPPASKSGTPPPKKKTADTGKPPFDEKAQAEAAEKEKYASAGVTDVEDQNEQKSAAEKPKEAARDNPPPAEPMEPFKEYKKAGEWFDFADPWLDNPVRIEADLVAFSAFYNDWIQERLSPSWKSAPVREGVKDTMEKFQAAMVRAQKKTKAAL